MFELPLLVFPFIGVLLQLHFQIFAVEFHLLYSLTDLHNLCKSLC